MYIYVQNSKTVVKPTNILKHYFYGFVSGVRTKTKKRNLIKPKNILKLYFYGFYNFETTFTSFFRCTYKNRNTI